MKSNGANRAGLSELDYSGNEDSLINGEFGDINDDSLDELPEGYLPATEAPIDTAPPSSDTESLPASRGKRMVKDRTQKTRLEKNVMITVPVPDSIVKKMVLLMSFDGESQADTMRRVIIDAVNKETKVIDRGLVSLRNKLNKRVR